MIAGGCPSSSCSALRRPAPAPTPAPAAGRLRRARNMPLAVRGCLPARGRCGWKERSCSGSISSRTGRGRAAVRPSGHRSSPMARLRLAQRSTGPRRAGGGATANGASSTSATRVPARTRRFPLPPSPRSGRDDLCRTGQAPFVLERRAGNRARPVGAGRVYRATAWSRARWCATTPARASRPHQQCGSAAATDIPPAVVGSVSSNGPGHATALDPNAASARSHQANRDAQASPAGPRSLEQVHRPALHRLVEARLGIATDSAPTASPADRHHPANPADAER